MLKVENSIERRLGRLIKFEYAWCILHFWALERYWDRWVPVLS